MAARVCEPMAPSMEPGEKACRARAICASNTSFTGRGYSTPGGLTTTGGITLGVTGGFTLAMTGGMTGGTITTFVLGTSTGLGGTGAKTGKVTGGGRLVRNGGNGAITGGGAGTGIGLGRTGARDGCTFFTSGWIATFLWVRKISQPIPNDTPRNIINSHAKKRPELFRPDDALPFLPERRATPVLSHKPGRGPSCFADSRFFQGSRRVASAISRAVASYPTRLVLITR